MKKNKPGLKISNVKMLQGNAKWWSLLAILIVATVVVATEVNNSKQPVDVMAVGVSAAKQANIAAREAVKKDNEMKRAATSNTAVSTPSLPAPKPKKATNTASNDAAPKPSPLKPPKCEKSPEQCAIDEALKKAQAAAGQAGQTANDLVGGAGAVANQVVQTGSQVVVGAGQTYVNTAAAADQALGAVVGVTAATVGQAADTTLNTFNYVPQAAAGVVSSTSQAGANIAGTVGGSAGEIGAFAGQNNMPNTKKLLDDIGGAANTAQQVGNTVASTTYNWSQPSNFFTQAGTTVKKNIINTVSNFANWLTGGN